MIGNKFKGLGKGLSALMGDIPQENAQTKNSSEKIPIHFVYAIHLNQEKILIRSCLMNFQSQ